MRASPQHFENKRKTGLKLHELRCRQRLADAPAFPSSPCPAAIFAKQELLSRMPTRETLEGAPELGNCSIRSGLALQSVYSRR